MTYSSITMALGPGLFSVHGKQDIFIIKRATLTRSESPFLGTTHRKQRKMLTPAFSAEHLRGLVPVFYAVTHKASLPLMPHVRANCRCDR